MHIELNPNHICVYIHRHIYLKQELNKFKEKMLGAEQYEFDFSISYSHIAADLDRTFKEGK